jgi:ribonuclease HI
MVLQLPETRTLLIYADGSVGSNNLGGVGIRIIHIDSHGDEVLHDASSSGYRNVTSCQIEIIACRDALQEVIRQKLNIDIDRVVIMTDSKYVSDHYQSAMFQWKRNGWRRSTGRPIPDAHLWKELLLQIKSFNRNRIFVDIQWVHGHHKDEHNRAVDQIAKKMTRLPLQKIPKNEAVSIFVPKRIISSRKMEIGCVEMKGQRISVKILAVDLLKPQNIWRYQYQVLTKCSPYCDCIDQIFSRDSLDVDKSYLIKVNSVTKNPEIIKVYRETKKRS